MILREYEKKHKKNRYGNYSTKFLVCKCDYCNKKFTRAKSEIFRLDRKSINHFCSRKCMGKWNSVNKIGIKAPNYSKKFNEATKRKMSITHSGNNNANWNNGRVKTSAGYIKIYKPEHPQNRHNYVLEHRLIMEKHLGRYLENFEIVHHKNAIKDDNRIDNLEIVLKKTHKGEIICPYCRKKFSLR